MFFLAALKKYNLQTNGPNTVFLILVMLFFCFAIAMLFMLLASILILTANHG